MAFPPCGPGLSRYSVPRHRHDFFSSGCSHTSSEDGRSTASEPATPKALRTSADAKPPGQVTFPRALSGGVDHTSPLFTNWDGRTSWNADGGQAPAVPQSAVKIC